MIIKKTVIFTIFCTIFIISSCNKNDEKEQIRNEMDKLKRSMDSLYNPEKMDSMKNALENELKELDTLKLQNDSIKKKIEELNKDLNN